MSIVRGTVAEETVSVKLNAARRELEKARKKYDQCQQAVQKYEATLEVLKEIRSEEKRPQSGIGESEKLEYVIEALHRNHGIATYEQIHAFLQENGINIGQTKQATYAFLKRRSRPENHIAFDGGGRFKYVEEQTDEDDRHPSAAELADITIEDVPF